MQHVGLHVCNWTLWKYTGPSWLRPSWSRADLTQGPTWLQAELTRYRGSTGPGVKSAQEQDRGVGTRGRLTGCNRPSQYSQKCSILADSLKQCCGASRSGSLRRFTHSVQCGPYQSWCVLVTLCLLISSADNLCKQFGPRWELKKNTWPNLGSKLFDTPIRIPSKRWFLEKNSRQQKCKLWSVTVSSI